MSYPNKDKQFIINERRNKLEALARLESASGVRNILVSDCCGAIVYSDTEKCPVCHKDYDPITESQFEENE